MKAITLTLAKTALKTTDLSVKLHGYLMSLLESAYVDFLHQQETNPYATYVETKADCHLWHIHLLTEEAISQMNEVIYQQQAITLDSYSETIKVLAIAETTLTQEELLTLFQSDNQPSLVTLHFVTPTSFKSQGEYVIFPDLRLIFQSLMQKYNRLIEGEMEIDQDVLQHLTQRSRVMSYHLKTWYFTLHKQKIPAFSGYITIKLYGAQTLKGYATMLLSFGEVSGIGIKTSLGMGGMRLEKP